MKHPFENIFRLPGLFLCFILILAGQSIAQEAPSQDIRKIVGRNVVHTVKSGENMLTIAQRYGLAVDHLAFANGYSPLSVTLPLGEKLIVPGERVLPKNPPSNGLVLNLPERGLYLFRGGKFDRFVPVSIGDEEGFQTPTGQYHIIERITNPTWYPPAWAEEKKPVGPGPDNPLGTHWIGLSLTRTGIHGTNQPLNVGNSVTHGCIRAYPKTIKKLYGDVKVGWPIRIEYETAKLGRGIGGRTKLVTFPDVYKKKDPVKTTAQLLGGRVPDNLRPLIGLNLGIAMDLQRNESLYQEVKRNAYQR
jgi:L,D-transpeptidase ErfK/SrfK